MNLNVSSTDSTDETLVSTERNSSISISFSDDENEKPSQALTKIQSDDEEIVDFSAQLESESIIVKSQEILKSEDNYSGVQKARKIKFSPLKNHGINERNPCRQRNYK